jgi:hypothetical protein
MTSPIKIESPSVRYSTDFIEADYIYTNTQVRQDAKGTYIATPTNTKYTFKTQRKVIPLSLHTLINYLKFLTRTPQGGALYARKV